MGLSAQQQACDFRQADRLFIGGPNLRLRTPSPALPIDHANDSNYGLHATVFSNNIHRAYGIACRLPTDAVRQNASPATLLSRSSGSERSGIGREVVREGIHINVDAKTIIFDEQPSTYSTYVSNSKEEVHS